MNLELLVDVLDVERDGVDADVQFGGRGLVVVTLDQKAKDPGFVGGQVVVGLAARANAAKPIVGYTCDAKLPSR